VTGGALPRELLALVVAFVRELRDTGVAASPASAIDASRALEAVDVGDRREVYLALRSVLTTRPEDYPIFDDLFARLWTAEHAETAVTSETEQRPLPPPDRRIPAPSLGKNRPTVSLERWMRSISADADEPVAVPLMSGHERLGEKDFSAFAPEELREITQVAARIARRLATRPSRRWQPARRGERISPRRTARQSFRTGGEAVALAYQRRRRRKAKLVVLCDVSGSMDLYSRFLLQFLYALQNVFARVETFVFSTRLRRITGALAGASYGNALQQLTRTTQEWSGGTRIGESLADFYGEWPHLVDRRTIVVILSDGWDTGEPEVLEDVMLRLRRSAGKLVWLNPLLGSPGYQPLTRGMQAALPYLDVFAPAHNLASLQALVRHLVL
jgi:uncharacterized protein with von Willebrand factor type A (vWA) domain